MEAALVKQHVKELTTAGVRAQDIAVVTPYNAQVRFQLFAKSSRPSLVRASRGYFGIKTESRRSILAKDYSDAFERRPTAPMASIRNFGVASLLVFA